ncbi:hypothetical protein [Streptomyces sp. CA-111067]|uniref:hypothetical protein n=1 Tax=Streptomyces sp. CA-111067 TaxID=3240046 RepID=UPI003D982A33
MPVPRVRSLEAACGRIADRPLAGTLAELRQALTGPITGEARRRLHVLVSTPYHRAGASLPLTEKPRAEIEAAPNPQHTEE